MTRCFATATSLWFGKQSKMFQHSKVLLQDINIDFSHYTNSPPIVVSNIQKYKYSIFQARTNGMSVHYKNVKLRIFYI